MIESNKARLEAIQNSHVTEQMLENHKKIDQLEIDHEKVWVKRSESTHSNLFHRLVYRMTKLKILMPVENKTPSESLHFEANKLRFLAQQGIPVPEVIGYDTHFLYLSDSGTDLRDYLKQTVLTQGEKEIIITKALKVLCAIHNNGCYHAGAQIKNYTIQDDQVSAIDFEDSFSDKYRLEDIQFRDFFLFLFSLASFNNNIIYQEVIELYRSLTGNSDTRDRLKNMARKTTPLLKSIDFISARSYLGHDVMSVCALLSFILSM
ncbi:phosphotransferase [Celerinatantimonas sp. YJH-8]|uniref:phosphotransferase n=1 Tax=Celerinatantimonas sp. YJH-8 TaxID=3228714 RepID=UPI0038C3F654